MFENCKLLNKIMYIDLHQSSLSPQAMMTKTLSPLRVSRKAASKDLRRQKSDIIQVQNAYLVKRLATAQSVYNSQKWNRDYSKHTMYRDMISKNTG